LKCRADVAGDDFADTLADLADYSLARRNADKQEFSQSSLVQDVTRRGLLTRSAGAVLVEALTWVNAGFVVNRRTFELGLARSTRAACARIVQHADGAEINEPTDV